MCSKVREILIALNGGTAEPNATEKVINTAYMIWWICNNLKLDDKHQIVFQMSLLECLEHCTQLLKANNIYDRFALIVKSMRTTNDPIATA